MQKLEIIKEDGLESHSLYSIGEFEFANPTEKFKEMYISISMGMRHDYIKMLARSKGIQFDPTLLETEIRKSSEKEWRSHYKSLKKLKVPQSLLAILAASSKKEQIKLLDGLHLSTDSLSSFIVLAGEKHNFSFSQYRVEFTPPGIDATKLPKLAYKDDDGKINSLGATGLKEGQIKNVIDQRKVIVSKFLDKGGTWHCFYLTYRGVYGHEKGHPPHIHYISNSFGISREKVLSELKSRNYNLPKGPHILYKR